MIKSQEEIDRSLRQGSRVERSGVFSDAVAGRSLDFILPLESSCIVIHHVEVEGDFSGGAYTKRVTAPIAGRCAGAAGIEKLASDLQDLIIRAGYITSRVTVPDQDLSSGTLRLKIVSGRIGRITIEGRDVSKAILPLYPEERLNLRDIEQGLEAMQRVPMGNVSIVVSPGEEPGYSDIAFRAEPRKRWNVRTWVNNWGEKSTGRLLAGGAFYLYNQAGWNDIFSLSINKNSEHRRGGYKNIGGYYSVPFGYWEYDIFYSTSTSSQQIGGDELGLMYTGKSRYLDIKGRRLLYRDKTQKVYASAGIIRRRMDYDLNGIQLVMPKRI
jgi:Hemolysin activation/secretion protein